MRGIHEICLLKIYTNLSLYMCFLYLKDTTPFPMCFPWLAQLKAPYTN